MMRRLRRRISDRLLWLAVAALPYGIERERLAIFCRDEMARRRGEAA
jgi:hypothetical protein